MFNFHGIICFLAISVFTCLIFKDVVVKRLQFYLFLSAPRYGSAFTTYLLSTSDRTKIYDSITLHGNKLVASLSHRLWSYRNTISKQNKK